MGVLDIWTSPPGWKERSWRILQVIGSIYCWWSFYRYVHKKFSHQLAKIGAGFVLGELQIDDRLVTLQVGFLGH